MNNCMNIKNKNVRGFKNKRILRRAYRDAVLLRKINDAGAPLFQDAISSLNACHVLSCCFTWAYTCEGSTYWNEKFISLVENEEFISL